MKTSNSVFTNLISILNDCKYHDGTGIGEKLNITRSAVWKAIQKLELYGIEVDSIKGKGYALLEPLLLLDPQKIKRLVKTKSMALDLFEAIPSTNDYLKTLGHQPDSLRVCIAETQTQGRGRFYQYLSRRLLALDACVYRCRL